MPKARTARQEAAVFQDPPPPQRAQKGRWREVLEPLLQAPGRWALIFTAESPAKAQGTVGNLKQRMVIIPNTEDNWEFISRDCEVYAKYMGKKQRARVRRVK